MQHFFKLLTLLLVASLPLVSCSDKDDEPNDPNNPGNSQSEYLQGSDNKITISSNGTTSDGSVVNYDGSRQIWINYVHYEIVDDHIEIVGIDKENILPEPKLYSEITVNGKKYLVTKIAFSAFKESKIYKIQLPNTVNKIATSAFLKCSNLVEIGLPNQLLYIDLEAFYGCTNLISIVIPNSVEYLGEFSFTGCTSLQSITLSNSITKIERRTFSGCISLVSFTIPKSVLSINYGVFAGCYNLETINFQGDAPNLQEPGSEFKHITAYVPRQCLENFEKYKKYFKDIVPYD